MAGARAPKQQGPKYRAIQAVLRQRILDGELAPGERLPPQQEMADQFSVTLMTLRQALGALEADGLVRAERGKGTFVTDRPVDISVGNLSSFADEMRSAGVELTTDVLDATVLAVDVEVAAAAALGLEGGDLLCVTRRRAIDGLPIGLQRSYLAVGVLDLEPGGDLESESLYEAIAGRTGWDVAEARESITAVSLTAEDAAHLDAAAGHPALLSIRTSINQFGQPFLYDEALLVGGRCTIAADRRSDRLSMSYGIS